MCLCLTKTGCELNLLETF